MTANPNPEAKTKRNIDLQVQADQLQLLYHQSFPALFISLIIATLLAWMLRRDIDTPTVAWWLGLLAASTLVRFALFLAYFRQQPRGPALLRWQRPYLVTLALSSSIWGVGALAVMTQVPLLDQAIICFVLVGMAGGGVSTYSAHRGAAVIAMISVLLPATIWLFLQGREAELGMAVGATVFMLASLRAASVTCGSLQRSFQLTRELEKSNDVAALLARTDALTGLNNRRAFFERGQQIVHYCQRNQRPLCILLMDVDHFKNINDSQGHAIGDAALQFIGDMLRDLFRKADVCGRIGGEEFAMLLPDTSLYDAQIIAETLRRAIAETSIPVPVSAGELQTLSLTVSIGVAAGRSDLDTLLSRADAAMYRAKAEGRNRVISCELTEI